MYLELEHTADLRYEIISSNFDEFLEDLLGIIKENLEYEEMETDDFKVKCYEILKNLNDDAIFDVVNDIISLVDRGYTPESTKGICMNFKKVLVKNFRIKALTYHMLSVCVDEEGRISATLVFDV